MLIKQIRETIEVGESLKVIAQSLSDIASLRLKKIRSEIEKNRSFLQEIGAVYGLVRQAAKTKGIASSKKSKGAVSILITSNFRFYGSVNNNLIQSFIIHTTKYNTDRVVVGRTGQAALKAMKYFHSFTEVSLKEDLPSLLELNNLAKMVADYEQVFVYYSQFQSVLVQVPKVTNINQTEVAKSGKVATQEANLPGFIFEPEVGKMLQFFESQISNTLLEQTFLESELARTASRLIAMDSAQVNAKQFIKTQNKELNREFRFKENSEILDLTASLFAITHK